MVRTLLAGIGLAFIILVSAMALQARGYFWPQPRPARLSISYTGLDLHTTQGIAALEGRIGTAIRDVCGLDLVCRRSAYLGTRPQVAKAALVGRELIGGVAFSIEPQLLELNRDQQRRIEAPLLRSFEKDASQSWWSYPDHGRISISDAVFYDDVECRNVRVTQARRTGDELLAQGLRCIVPKLLPIPVTIRHP